MALKYNLSWLHSLNITLAILTVSLAIEEGQIKCLHSEYDKFSVKNDLHLCCVYRKAQTERMEHISIKWENKSSSKELSGDRSHAQLEPLKDDVLMWCIDIKKGDYDNGHRMSCSVISKDTSEPIGQCIFEVALFYHNPLDFHAVTKFSWSIVSLLSSLFLIVIFILFLKLMLKLCRKSARYSFHDTAFEGMTPTSRESVFYSRIASVSNQNMFGPEEAETEAMLNRSRYPTYLQVEVDESENVIDEEVYENEGELSRTRTGSENHPDLVKSDKGSLYRKAAPLPNTQRTISTSSTNTIDCRNHCCLHHHITRNRPGCFKKPLERYTSV